jgi:hypothetical protein
MRKCVTIEQMQGAVTARTAEAFAGAAGPCWCSCSSWHERKYSLSYVRSLMAAQTDSLGVQVKEGWMRRANGEVKPSSPVAATFVVDGRGYATGPLEKTLPRWSAAGWRALGIAVLPSDPCSTYCNNGFAWQEDILDDGTHEIRIRRA